MALIYIMEHLKALNLSGLICKPYLINCKEECINLTKQGELDLIICRSPQGHEYLRARTGSSINDSLGKLIVRDRNKKLDQEHVLQVQVNKEKMDVVY